MAEWHHRDNAVVRPDLIRMLARFRSVLSTLPVSLHEEFRNVLLQIEDFEALIRPLYPAFDLAAAHQTEEWTAFRKQLEEHAFRRALAAERF